MKGPFSQVSVLMDMYIIIDDKKKDNVFLGWFIPDGYTGVPAPVTWIMPCCVLPFGRSHAV